ncbi:UDP-N-acetylglucosamine 2-epimerase [Labilithrix luteola]|uniref:UDP-N-acetylglucosamine 2-epimerase (non-hydrolyzing) n=1 Tax=Labilithrix luteola TaxID=1391654 RepID=A0A0K1QES9_9BACT|nr:UDP-N-acetylglucosamine 2-epimerase [Labilithrix luteola]
MSKSKLKILVVFGTRPEAIKMAPLVTALRRRPDVIDAEVCVTAQHRSMLDQVLETFQLAPEYDLDVMREAQPLADMTSRILLGLRDVIRASAPDWVLVQGDTTTAFAAALAAFYEKKLVGHVEAGLRTRRKHSPWPEETNRQLVGTLADMHFAPTARAKHNLMLEHVDPRAIVVSGNTVVDALLSVAERCRTVDRHTLAARFPFIDPSKKLILVTGHRRESFGDAFREMCHALVDVVAQRPDVQLVYPVHLNPNVQEPVHAILGTAPPDVRARIHLIAPVEYAPFVYLMDQATFIVTDSGGVQEEAPSLGKPVLVTRNDTERPEALDAGTARIVGTSRVRIVREVLRLLDDPRVFERMSRAHNPYGDGHASERIVEALLARAAESADVVKPTEGVKPGGTHESRSTERTRVGVSELELQD